MSTDMEIESNTGYETTFCSSIVEDLYLNEEFADFHFVCKTNDAERERIPAHKILLRGSDVFRAMFKDEWEDKTEVEIVDASAAAFKEFLQFFYLTKVNLTMENVGFVMNLGNKYNVRECMEVCCKFLTDSITNDNVCTAYGLAMFFEQEKLSKYCEAIIRTDTKAVLSSSGFLESDRKVLKYILYLDFISCSEVEVFEAYMTWVKLKTGEEHLRRETIQAQLGHLWYEFRFSSMSPEEFAMLLSSYGQLFSVAECVEISQLTALNGFKPTMFCEKERKAVADFKHDGANEFCNRLLSGFYSVKPYYIKQHEVTTFSVSEPILLKGLKFVGIHKYKHDEYYFRQEDLDTEIEIAQVSKESTEQILLNQKANISCDVYTSIKLHKTILIRPNLMYEIRCKQSSPADRVAGVLLKSEVKLDSGITVKFHRDPSVEFERDVRGVVGYLKFKTI